MADSIIIASGDWWSLDNTGTLRVFCVGDMPYSGSPPWYDIRDDIRAAVIQNGATNIRDGAFAACVNLASVKIPDSVTSIGNSAFRYCHTLKRVAIGKGVTTIEIAAFEHCEFMDSVTIPVNVTTVENSAFNDCASLADVYYAGLPSQWDLIAIGAYNDPLLNAAYHYWHGRDYYAPIIAGLDCSGIVNAYSMQCEIFERTGDNGGLLRNGTEIKDVLARKIRLSWLMNSVSSAQYAALRAAVPVNGPASVTVFDPSVNNVRTADFYVTLPVFQYAFTPPGAPPMASAGQTLTIEEA